MIIVATNRTVYPDKEGHEKFGDRIGGTGVRFATVSLVPGKTPDMWCDDDDEDCESSPDTWKVDLVDVGHEADQLFNSIVEKINGGDALLSRPWVFFLHGNNQSAEKNFRKCQLISNKYNVNVISFSWPSKPRTFIQALGKAVLGMVSPLDLKDLVTGAVKVSGLSVFQFVTKLIGEKKDDYMEARRRAVDSADSFADTIYKVNKLMLSRLNNDPGISLLVHSLGNFVYENVDISEYKTKTGEKKLFKNVVLHQADCHAYNYGMWIEESVNAFGDNAYVTSNEKDAILTLSLFANRRRRVGMGGENFSRGILRHIDFTDGHFVSSEHALFAVKPNKNQQIHDLFEKLLTSQIGFELTDMGYEKDEIGRYRLEDRIYVAEDLDDYDPIIHDDFR